MWSHDWERGCFSLWLRFWGSFWLGTFNVLFSVRTAPFGPFWKRIWSMEKLQIFKTLAVHSCFAATHSEAYAKRRRICWKAEWEFPGPKFIIYDPDRIWTFHSKNRERVCVSENHHRQASAQSKHQIRSRQTAVLQTQILIVLYNASAKS